MPRPTLEEQDEWLWGWDPTPGIVSVWAESDGTALIWRRPPDSGELVREEQRFRPWILIDRLDDIQLSGTPLARDGDADAPITYVELDGPGALRFLVSATEFRTITNAVLDGASRRLERRITQLRELGTETVLALPPEEQYLVAT